jgi:sugar lactone lactonase YvrE
MASDDLDSFRLTDDDFRFVGRDLHRAECVLCTASGHVYVADWRGGVTCIAPDGSQRLLTAAPGAGRPMPKPNGIALLPDGAFLLADLGELGGVWRLDRDGTLTPLLLEVDGHALPPTNFVMVDARERVWVTVSTRMRPRQRAQRPDVADGFIVLLDDKGARIVADGLGYTNEVALDDAGEWLYVNETFSRRLSRFRLREDGSLSPREVVTEFGHGTYPDGLTFDALGGIWITSVVSNRIIRVRPDGSQHLVFEDADPAYVEDVEQAYRAGGLDASHLGGIRSRRLQNISSLAFGGPDLRTAYLGCLLGDRLAVFRSPVPGRPPVHWHAS